MDDGVIGALLGAAIGGMIFFILGSIAGQAVVERSAIQHLHAHYDIQSGAFTWNDEGKK